VDHREPLAFCGLRKAIVKGHDLEGCRIVLSPTIAAQRWSASGVRVLPRGGRVVQRGRQLAGRWPSCPRTAPPGSPFLEQGLDSTGVRRQPRRRCTQQIERWRGVTDPDDTGPFETVQAAGRVRERRYRLQPSDRHTAIEDKDALPTSDPIDERTEPILGLRDRCRVHLANVAISFQLVKPSPRAFR
jgi:hypothetical protein